MRQGFASPFEIQIPPECEGWEELYPYYLLFSPDRREEEEERFWFLNTMHYTEPLAPFDIIAAEAGHVGIGEMSHRIFLIPGAKGMAFRILLGYVYMSPTPITDPQEVERRTPYFLRRAGSYYEQWEEVYANWKRKVTEEIRALESLRFPPLPEVEEERVVLERRGVGLAWDVLHAYHRALESIYRVWQLHMEIVMIGFGEYLTFYQFCKQAFPEIPDPIIPRMVSGINVSMFRPNDELKRLARLAGELGIEAAFQEGRTWQEVWRVLESTEEGRRWLGEWEQSADPWFYMSTGDGFHHTHRAWKDDPTPVLSVLPHYIERIRAGESLDRPLEELVAERDRIAAEYRGLLPSEEDRRAFDQMLHLTRRVYYAIEDHKFYVEQWYQSLFWNKIRELGGLFVQQGFFEDPEEVFYLKPREVSEALHDLLLAWSAGCGARGPRYWQPVIQRRRRIHRALRKVTPPPFLGRVPEKMTDPAVVMLWGFTPDRIRSWLEPHEENVLRGIPGAPGVAEGPARVVFTAEELSEVRAGEILVCPVTEPSWAPVFAKVKATVSDIGGIMSHAAIVAREYGIPAVLGTGAATQRIRTGQRIRVDGDTGTVTLLD
jgi:pyruvate,water dikinase